MRKGAANSKRMCIILSLFDRTKWRRLHLIFRHTCWMCKQQSSRSSTVRLSDSFLARSLKRQAHYFLDSKLDSSSCIVKKLFFFPKIRSQVWGVAYTRINTVLNRHYCMEWDREGGRAGGCQTFCFLQPLPFSPL